MAITVFLSRSPGLLNWGPTLLGAGFLYRILSPTPTAQSGAWGSTLLGAGFLYRILSSTASAQSGAWGCWLSLPHLLSNYSNFLCTELYNSSTSTFFLWASQITLIQPVHGQGYILIFLEWMHLLFTLVYFLFWQPGRFGSQYTTHVSSLVKGGIYFNISVAFASRSQAEK